MSTTLSIEQAALLLREAEHHKQTIPPLRTRLSDSTTDQAYAIQELNTQHRLAQGERLVGRKIGLTSVQVQQQLGVDQPDFGMLFANMSVGDGASIAFDSLIQPKVEAEIALILGRDLNHEQHTYADLLRATEYCLPAIEIVDSRIHNWDIGFVDTVADNASAARFVLGGRPVNLSDVDLSLCAMQLTANEQTLSQGSGRACLGNPLNAALWLADTMVRYGRPLQAGDIVLTGALGPMVTVCPQTHYAVQIQGLGSVNVFFN